MTTLRRLTSTIKANFDWMVTQVENHEGLVASAISEVQTAQARARVHFGQLKRDGENLRKRLADLNEAEVAWTERAVQSAELDEKRALECVRRRQRIQKEKKELEVQVKNHERMQEQLAKDLVLIEERLDQLKRQRNVLRTRQSRAEALRAAHLDESGIINELDEILERWEIKVTEAEVRSECLKDAGDDFERSFVSEEEESELKTILAELTTKSSRA